MHVSRKVSKNPSNNDRGQPAAGSQQQKLNQKGVMRGNLFHKIYLYLGSVLIWLSFSEVYRQTKLSAFLTCSESVWIVFWLHEDEQSLHVVLIGPCPLKYDKQRRFLSHIFHKSFDYSGYTEIIHDGVSTNLETYRSSITDSSFPT